MEFTLNVWSELSLDSQTVVESISTSFCCRFVHTMISTSTDSLVRILQSYPILRSTKHLILGNYREVQSRSKRSRLDSATQSPRVSCVWICGCLTWKHPIRWLTSTSSSALRHYAKSRIYYSGADYKKQRRDYRVETIGSCNLDQSPQWKLCEYLHADLSNEVLPLVRKRTLSGTASHTIHAVTAHYSVLIVNHCPSCFDQRHRSLFYFSLPSSFFYSLSYRHP